MSDSPTPPSLNRALVELLKRRGDLTDERLEAAFLAVPRHLFLPAIPLENAYQDEAIAVKRDSDGSVLSSSSQPGMIATMLEQLDLRPGDNVLEIGAGTGYSAALMQHLVGDTGRVTSVELDKDLAQQATDSLQHLSIGSKVTIVHGDGALGYAPRAAYDRIVASVGMWDIPPAWIQQLKREGILVAPLWLDALQASAAFRLQRDGSLYSADNVPCGFVHLRGAAAGPRVVRRVASSALTIVSSAADRLDTGALHALLSSDDREQNYLSAPLASSDYWHGLLPYLILNLPAGFTLALYNLLSDLPAYGIEGHGFALLEQGSAAFVPYQGQGMVYAFGSSDAFVALQECLTAWDAAGRIGIARLRLRLTPIQAGIPPETEGRIYPRRYHYLRVWFE